MRFPYVECGWKVNSSFRRNEFLKVEALDEFRHAHHNTDIFHTVWSYAEPRADSDFYGSFYLDLDSENLDAAHQDSRNVARFLTDHLRISEHSVQVFFTGKKGFNILVDAPVLGVEPRPELHQIWKVLASNLHERIAYHTIDLKVYDKRRLLRFANSIHGDTGLYKILLTLSELESLNSDDVKEKARSPGPLMRSTRCEVSHRAASYLRALLRGQQRQRAARSARRSPDALIDEPPCIKALLAGVGEGERNQALFSLACFYHQQGLGIDHILARLKDWNARNAPPLQEQELRCSVASAVKGIYKLGCSSPSLKEHCDLTCGFSPRR